MRLKMKIYQQKHSDKEKDGQLNKKKPVKSDWNKCLNMHGNINLILFSLHMTDWLGYHEVTLKRYFLCDQRDGEFVEFTAILRLLTEGHSDESEFSNWNIDVVIATISVEKNPR